jgi:plasmid stability protein
MVRTQILLDEQQAKALRVLAAAEGRSMAELVRSGVEHILRSQGAIGGEDLKRRALEAAGRFHSGLHDLGTEHDRHLSRAFAE